MYFCVNFFLYGCAVVKALESVDNPGRNTSTVAQPTVYNSNNEKRLDTPQVIIRSSNADKPIDFFKELVSELLNLCTSMEQKDKIKKKVCSIPENKRQPETFDTASILTILRILIRPRKEHYTPPPSSTLFEKVLIGIRSIYVFREIFSKNWGSIMTLPQCSEEESFDLMNRILQNIRNDPTICSDMEETMDTRKFFVYRIFEFIDRLFREQNNHFYKGKLFLVTVDLLREKDFFTFHDKLEKPFYYLEKILKCFGARLELKYNEDKEKLMEVITNRTFDLEIETVYEEGETVISDEFEKHICFDKEFYDHLVCKGINMDIIWRMIHYYACSEKENIVSVYMFDKISSVKDFSKYLLFRYNTTNAPQIDYGGILLWRNCFSANLKSLPPKNMIKHIALPISHMMLRIKKIRRYIQDNNVEELTLIGDKELSSLEELSTIKEHLQKLKINLRFEGSNLLSDDNFFNLVKSLKINTITFFNQKTMEDIAVKRLKELCSQENKVRRVEILGDYPEHVLDELRHLNIKEFRLRSFTEIDEKGSWEIFENVCNPLFYRSLCIFEGPPLPDDPCDKLWKKFNSIVNLKNLYIHLKQNDKNSSMKVTCVNVLPKKTNLERLHKKYKDLFSRLEDLSILVETCVSTADKEKIAELSVKKLTVLFKIPSPGLFDAFKEGSNIDKHLKHLMICFATDIEYTFSVNDIDELKRLSKRGCIIIFKKNGFKLNLSDVLSFKRIAEPNIPQKK